MCEGETRASTDESRRRQRSGGGKVATTRRARDAKEATKSIGGEEPLAGWRLEATTTADGGGDERGAVAATLTDGCVPPSWYLELLPRSRAAAM